jgi:hypothetical protein
MEWGRPLIRALKISVVTQDYPMDVKTLTKLWITPIFSSARWNDCFALEPILMAFVSCNVPFLVRYFHLGEVFLCDLCIG